MSHARARTRVLVGAALLLTLLLPGLAATAPAQARTGVRPAATPSGTTGGSPAASTAADSSEATPLTVTLTSLSPAVIPRRGVITLTGSVRNASEETWTEVNVAPFVSSAPITSRTELAEASATAEDVAVGDRLTDSGTYAALGDLAPGQARPFRLRVPVTSLGISGAPGVYWFGAHALGTDTTGRDNVADGRARTFLPLVTAPRARPVAPVSVVLPFRDRTRRAFDGRLNGPARWVALTGPRGRLTRVADFAASSGGAPFTWLVDPAVLDALGDFAQGNPPLSLGGRERTTKDDGGGEDPAGTPSSSPSETLAPPSATSGTAEDGPTEGQRTAAAGVLDTFLATARTTPLLALGYSDPDAVSLARRRPSLLSRADALSVRRLAARGLQGTKTVAPPDGYFDPDLLPQLATDALVVLSDHGRLTSPTSSRLPSGQEMVLTDARASAGGPAPIRAQDPLALRQRVLAEAALEVTSGSTTTPPRPVVLTLPSDWDPGAAWQQADFFGGLSSVPWLRLSPLERSATTTYAGTLPYGSSQRTAEVGDANVAATRTLTRTGGVLGHLLANTNDVDDALTGAALGASSYSARQTRKLAVDQAIALDTTARSRMDQVEVTTGDDFVTLSGGSGVLILTLVNGLRQPITVGVRARTDSPDVKVSVSTEPVQLGPGQRTTLKLAVTSKAGVHDVTLYPVTDQDEVAGKAFTFSLRTSQVGRLIWYIVIAGGALLAVMIVRRIVLRIRDHQWRREPA